MLRGVVEKDLASAVVDDANAGFVIVGRAAAVAWCTDRKRRVADDIVMFDLGNGGWPAG